jgi:MoxR-like ATPase
MQEQQVTLGGESYPVPRPFLVLATQNPIESEGTYQLPEAQLDRFLFKLLVDYPTINDEAAVVEQSLDVAPAVREVMQITELERFREISARVFVDRRVVGYAVRLADATRHPEKHGLADIAPLIEYGASPRGPIGLAHSARALALLRGRDYATSRDVRDVAADVLRHRLVLSYEALADGVSADDILDRVIDAVDPQDDERPVAASAARR